MKLLGKTYCARRYSILATPATRKRCGACATTCPASRVTSATHPTTSYRTSFSATEAHSVRIRSLVRTHLLLGSFLPQPTLVCCTMAARPPLPVPYGLSREYEDFLTKGKTTTKHIEQLRSRSAPIFTEAVSSHAQNRRLPISTASAASLAPKRPCRVSKNRKSDIESQRNITSPLSKPKLVRSKKRFKPSVPVSEALICPPVPGQQIRTSVAASLDAHLGTCHESPITLDSDSEEPIKSIKPDAVLRDASG